MILNNAFTIYKKNNKIYLKNSMGKETLIKQKEKGNFLSVLKDFRDRAPLNKELYESPIPLGGLGYLGYEFSAKSKK